MKNEEIVLTLQMLLSRIKSRLIIDPGTPGVRDLESIIEAIKNASQEIMKEKPEKHTTATICKPFGTLKRQIVANVV